MKKIIVIIIGLIISAIGGFLIRRFGERANRSGIGSFTLLPIAGIAYLVGVLCIILGAFTIIFGLFI